MCTKGMLLGRLWAPRRYKKRLCAMQLLELGSPEAALSQTVSLPNTPLDRHKKRLCAMQLLDLGFPEPEARRAAEAAGGDAERAAALLLEHDPCTGELAAAHSAALRCGTTVYCHALCTGGGAAAGALRPGAAARDAGPAAHSV